MPAVEQGPFRESLAEFARFLQANWRGWRRPANQGRCSRAGAGETVFDVRSFSSFVGPLSYIARGNEGAPGMHGGTPSYDGQFQVIGTSAGLPPVGTLGGGGGYCNPCVYDWDAFVTSDQSHVVPLAGDASISMAGPQFANTTTLVWVRFYPAGSWP